MKRADQHQALNSSPSFLPSPRGVHWKSFTLTMDIPPVRQQTAKWGNEAVKKREFQIQRLKLPPQPHTQNHCQQPRTKIYHFESKARFSHRDRKSGRPKLSYSSNQCWKYFGSGWSHWSQAREGCVFRCKYIFTCNTV